MKFNDNKRNFSRSLPSLQLTCAFKLATFYRLPNMQSFMFQFLRMDIEASLLENHREKL